MSGDLNEESLMEAIVEIAQAKETAGPIVVSEDLEDLAIYWKNYTSTPLRIFWGAPQSPYPDPHQRSLTKEK